MREGQDPTGASTPDAPSRLRQQVGKAGFSLEHPIETLRFLIHRDRTRWEAVKAIHGPRSQPLEDLAEHRGSSLLDAALLAAGGPGRVAESWSTDQPETREEIESWHQDADAWPAELAWWNAQPLYHRLLERLKGERDGVCLVYGGGIGGEAMRLSAQGNEVWYCDLPDTPIREFATWRSERHGLGWRFVSEVPDEEECFDCAVAFNVFGSLPAEVLTEMLPKITRTLKPGALLYCNQDWDERPGQPYIHDHEELWHSLVAELPLEVKSVSRSTSSTKYDFCVLAKKAGA